MATFVYYLDMEPDKNIAPEAEKSKYKLESDIDTPREELEHLRRTNKRKDMLLTVAAIFIIGLGVTLWYVLVQQNS
jgi:hypothetical protein